MKRLTHTDDGINYRLPGVADYQLIDRLAAYENTGLSPEEVTELAKKEQEHD